MTHGYKNIWGFDNSDSGIKLAKNTYASLQDRFFLHNAYENEPAVQMFWQMVLQFFAADATAHLYPIATDIKLAQKILRAGNFEMMQKKLLDGDIEGLTAIAGVGKKTAQKIILELKGVLVSEEPVSPQDNDTLEALLMLGYSQKEGLFALKQLTKNSPEERIKEALKYLSHGP